MINFNDAKLIADEYIDDLQKEAGISLRITKAQEELFGWVFFYQSKNFLETGELSSMLAGNSPFIVNRNDGRVSVTGTAKTIEEYIEDYSLLYKKC